MFSKSVKFRSTFIILTAFSLFVLFVTGCDSAPGSSAGYRRQPGYNPEPPTGYVPTNPNPQPPAPQPSGTYPASHSPMPQMTSSGGPVMVHAQFKVISFPSNEDVASIEKFVSVLGSSPEWTAMTSEYGIGPASADTPVHLQEQAPAQISDQQIQSWLSSKFNDPSRPLGSPDSSKIYIIYYPEGTTVMAGNNVQSCVNFDGYHTAFQEPNSGVRIIYAVIPRCQNFTLDDLTPVFTHELVEAVEDPDVSTGYNSVSQDFSIWQTLSSGGEGGDLCQNYASSDYTPADLGFKVQREWSNKAAAEGKDPCVPVESNEVYFNASPVVSDTVHYNAGGQSSTSKGILIPVGQSKTVELDLYSTGPTSAWTLSTFEPGNGGGGGNGGNGSAKTLDISFSQQSGVNGDKIQMTITVNSQNQQFGAEPFWIVSTLNGVSHYWPVVVGNE